MGWEESWVSLGWDLRWNQNQTILAFQPVAGYQVINIQLGGIRWTLCPPFIVFVIVSRKLWTLLNLFCYKVYSVEMTQHSLEEGLNMNVVQLQSIFCYHLPLVVCEIMKGTNIFLNSAFTPLSVQTEWSLAFWEEISCAKGHSGWTCPVYLRLVWGGFVVLAPSRWQWQ